MKKLIAIISVALITLNGFAHAGTENKQELATTMISQQEADDLVDRLYEINEMDKSGMSSSEKKELRGEVLSIKNQLEANPVIYISGGALILIIILLIILL